MFQPMIADAARRPALWRLFAGSVTAVAMTFLWLFAIVAAIAVLEDVGLRGAAGLLFGGGADTPSKALAFLLVVSGLAFGTAVAARMWQGRTLSSLVGPGARTLRHFAVAAGLTWLMIGGLSLLSVPADESVVRQGEMSTWLLWLLPGLVAVALQTGAEEVFFRGYLQSQFAARFRSRWVWLGVPALCFGFAHYSAGLPVDVAWAYVVFATLFGLIAGDLLARTGSLGAAWGLHFANNAFAILVIATEGTISGLGLYMNSVPLDEIDPLNPLVLLDILPLLVLWWVLGRILAR